MMMVLWLQALFKNSDLLVICWLLQLKTDRPNIDWYMAKCHMIASVINFSCGRRGYCFSRLSSSTAPPIGPKASVPTQVDLGFPRRSGPNNEHVQRRNCRTEILFGPVTGCDAVFKSSMSGKMICVAKCRLT